MNNLKKEISICIAFDNELNRVNYEEIINSLDYNTEGFISLSSLEDNIKINSDLLIIDISSKISLLKSQFFELSSNCKIIVISPFLQKHLNLPAKIKANHYHSLIKPLDIEHFSKLLESSSSNILRNRYLNDKENILLELVDKSPFKMAVYNKEGKIVYSNKDYLDSFEDELLDGRSYFDTILKCDIKFEEVIFNLKSKLVYVVQRLRDSRWYKSHFYYLHKGDYIAHIFYDITQDKNNMESLKKTGMFFEKSSEGAVITDKNGYIITLNTAFSKITGFTKDEAVGKSTSILASGIHEKSFYENLWDNLKFHGKWQGEIWNRRKNGEVFPEWLSITQIKDEKSGEINYLALFTDISSIKEADKKLHFYAKHDHLTGLLNRVQFESMLTHTIDRANRNNNKFALMYIDLDHFKEINDTYGHNVGDIMLKNVSSIIRNTLRKEDIIARVGGDEFNIILDHIKDEADVISIASKLNEVIKKEIKIDNKTFYMSFSIGVSIYPEHGDNPSDLIKNADSAMYQVKKEGRDGFLLYNSHFTKTLMRKVTLQNKLKKAIKNETFELYYQPVINYKDFKIIGAEALIRWQDKDKGFIPPDEFIPIAEDHGMIFDLGDIVLKKALDELRAILNNINSDFKLSINVSSREFFAGDYIERLKEKINDFHINPLNIELEITETYVMQNYDEAIERFESLKKLGVSLAIDDFGTGYSSLNYLKKFPLDKLKIDKSFILDILEDKDDKLIVETIINMAKIFDFQVQAEGIETKEHEELLTKLNCDSAQGYFYAKPMPLEQFLEYVRQYDEKR